MMSKLGSLTDRFEEVSALLSDAEVMSNREKFTALSKEFAEIEPVVLCYQEVTGLNDDLEEVKYYLPMTMLKFANWQKWTFKRAKKSFLT